MNPERPTDPREQMEVRITALLLGEASAFEEAELLDAILDECSKFSENELLPINRSGDEQGCVFADGEVTTPAGYREAYAHYIDGGWAGMSGPVEYGGQGLPNSVGIVPSLPIAYITREAPMTVAM